MHYIAICAILIMRFVVNVHKHETKMWQNMYFMCVLLCKTHKKSGIRHVRGNTGFTKIADRKVRIHKMTKKHVRWGWVFVSPYLFHLLVLTLIPLFISVYFSFVRYDLLTPPKWVGLQNYYYTLTSPQTWYAFRNVTVYAVLLEAIKISGGCVLGVLLNQKIKGLSLFRNLYQLPGLTPTTAMALIWARMFNPNGGVLNIILGFVGLGPFMFNYSSNWLEVIFSVVIMTAWQMVGSTTIYVLAALQGISQDVMEAADIDGANSFHKFFRITIPLITPTIFFLMIIGFSGSLQTFETFYILGEATGAETEVINSMVYSLMWGSSQVGRASALGWVAFVYIGLITFLQKKFEKKWVHYDA